MATIDTSRAHTAILRIPPGWLGFVYVHGGPPDPRFEETLGRVALEFPGSDDPGRLQWLDDEIEKDGWLAVASVRPREGSAVLHLTLDDRVRWPRRVRVACSPDPRGIESYVISRWLFRSYLRAGLWIAVPLLLGWGFVTLARGSSSSGSPGP